MQFNKYFALGLMWAAVGIACCFNSDNIILGFFAMFATMVIAL